MRQSFTNKNFAKLSIFIAGEAIMKRLIVLLPVLFLLFGCVWKKDIHQHYYSGEKVAGVTFPLNGGDLPGHAARVSSWDQTGHNADSIRIMPGETAVLADISGPGVIRHIWSTTTATPPAGRTLVLRFYWDGAENPSVEVPYGDFFASGHGMEADVDSFPIDVSSRGRSRNCWWRMPFESGARITLENQGDQAVGGLYYYIDYLALDDSPPTRQRFHAVYHQAYPADFPDNYVILRTEGKGSYLGCVMNVESTEPNWWGEGDDLIEVDNHEPLRGTGTEDYFCEAWGMREHDRLFHGSTICEGYDAAGLRSTMYRFHILDPIPFQNNIKVSIEHGTENDRADNLSSVAFWLQEPVVSQLPELPPVEDRLSGEKRVILMRARAWRLATSDDAGTIEKLNNLREKLRVSENEILVDGLLIYAQGMRNPDQESLKKMEKKLESLESSIEKMPEEKLYKEPDIDMPTDDDNLIPANILKTSRMLQRALHDLSRRVALAQGLEPGDEIIVEARDSTGELTPAPAYKDSADFTDSYAKVDDVHLMGNGARFTYGEADPSRARFTPDFPKSGKFEVLVIFSYGANAGDTRYEVRHSDGKDVIPIKQLGRPGTPGRNNREWHSLGTYRFQKGRSTEKGSVTLNAAPGTAIPNDKFEYRAYADSVRFVFRGK